IRNELQIKVDVIDGQDEGRYGFTGAVHGLPVASGLLFDLGGGSIQISHFVNRVLDRVITLPLGALRVSELFLGSDPPRSKEIHRLRKHVEKHLASARVPSLGRRNIWLAPVGRCETSRKSIAAREVIRSAARTATGSH